MDEEEFDEWNDRDREHYRPKGFDLNVFGFEFRNLRTGLDDTEKKVFNEVARRAFRLKPPILTELSRTGAINGFEKITYERLREILGKLIRDKKIIAHTKEELDEDKFNLSNHSLLREVLSHIKEARGTKNSLIYLPNIPGIVDFLKSHNHELIVRYLQQKKGSEREYVTKDEIAEAFGINNTRANEWLKKAHKDKFIQKLSRAMMGPQSANRYALPSKGLPEEKKIEERFN